MAMMERIQRSTRTRQGDGERSMRFNKSQQQMRQTGIGNQAKLRRLSAKHRRADQPPVQEPDTLDGKAVQIVERFESDPMDQSGRTRAELDNMEPDLRVEVMGRVQNKVSETQFGRIEQIAREPAPRSPEAPPKEIRPSEQPEAALVSEHLESVQDIETPGAEDKSQEPAAEEKIEPSGKQEEESLEYRKKESESQKEKQDLTEDKETEKKSGAKVTKEKSVSRVRMVHTRTDEEHAAQKQSEKHAKDKGQGDEEAAKATKANQTLQDQKAQQTTARASEPVQDQSAQALSELPAEMKGPDTEKPAAPGAPARQAAAQGGPAAVAVSGGESTGGSAEAALEESAAEESPEKESEADKTEEKMAGAEGSTEPEEEKEQEPPEPEFKAETEDDFNKKPTSEDEEAVKQAERERQEQTRNPEGAAATQAEEEQEPPPAERAEINPAEARAGLESLAEGVGGGGESMGGGGGGGGAVTEQPQPEPPKVEALAPVAAMSAASGLKVGQISKSLSGIQSSVSQKMSAEHSDLVANAPSMERPSGAPQTRQSRIGFEDSTTSGKAQVETSPEAQAIQEEAPELLPDPGPSPTDQVAAPSIQGGGEGGTLSEADAANIEAAVDDVPTNDPALEQTPGPAPTVELVGEADPQQAADQRAALDQSIVEEQTQGAQDVARPMGENEIYPVVPQETLTAKIPEGGGGGAAVVPTADDETASIVAEEKQGDEVRASTQQASSEMQTGEQDQAAKTEEEKTNHESKVQALEEQNATQQAGQRNAAGIEVQQLRGKWSQGQQQAVDTAHSGADSAQATLSGEVKTQYQQGNEKAAAETERGNTEASQIRENAQSEAEQKKAKAKQESSGGILGWIASKAKAFFEGLKKAVHAVFDFARKALKTLIDGVKKLAAAAIDLARNAIIGAIRLAGKALIALGDVALAAFPEMRDQFRGYIEDKVKAAEDTVNKLADELKAGINKLLDLLGSALNGLLNLLEKAYMAAIDAVAAVVQGAIKAAQAAIALLGVLAVIIKDVAANPGQWIANLGAAIIDGIKNHLWKAFKETVKNWFFSKLEQVVGVGKMIFDVLFKGGIKLAEVGKMAFEGLKAAIPVALITILVEKLVAMIVPAVGAVMVIIEGLQAAWGAVSRILQAIGRFVAFLKAVKLGSAGPKFADALASAAVVVIDFVASWLIKKIRGPASKIGSKIKAIAKKIMAKLKAVAKKIGGAVKKIAGKIKGAFKKTKEKLFGKKKSKGKDSKKKKQIQEQKNHERLNKALGVIRPGAQGMIASHASSWRLKAKLMHWKLRYRLSKLALVRQGNQELVEAAASPTQIAAQAVHLETSHLHKMIREVADQLMQLPEVQNKVEQLVAQRASGVGADFMNPIQASSSPLVTGADIAQNPRFRPKEFFSVGESPGAVATGSIWRSSTTAPNAIIAAPTVGDPSYQNLVSQLPAIGSPATAGLFEQFHQSGFLPPAMPQQTVQTFGALTQIAGVEVARDPAHAVRYAAALDAMKKGKMSAEDVFILQNPLAPKKQKGMPTASRTASEINTDMNADTPSKFKTPLKGAEAKALPQKKNEFLSKEKQIMIAWMESRMIGTDPLFSTEEEARNFIKKHLYDYLMRLGRSTFGV